MRRITERLSLMVCIGVAMANAGGLYVEVSSPASNSEASELHAALLARVTACHEPAKSLVIANLIRWDGRKTERTPLRVIALKTPGDFAIVGTVPAGSVVDVAVTNPEYTNYQPHVLIPGGEKEVRLAGAKHFFGTPPSDNDVRSLIQQKGI